MSGMLKKIDAASPSALHPSLALFTVPSTNCSVERSFYREFPTSAPLTLAGPYVFNIHTDVFYTDLSRSWYMLELALERKENNSWDRVKTEDNVSVIQNLATSFFRDIRMSINSVEVSTEENLNAYNAHMTLELGLPLEVKATRLAASGYNYHANPLDMGQRARKAIYSANKTVQLCTNLHTPLATTDRFLCNNCSLDLIFFRNSDEFCLHKDSAATPGEFRLRLIDFKIYLHSIVLYNSLNLAISSQLNKQFAKYVTRKHCMQAFFCEGGRYQFGPCQVFSDRLPRRIFVAMVDKAAFQGSAHLNPFHFKNFDLRELIVTCGGQQLPVVPMNLKFPNRCMQGFKDLMQTLDLPENKSNGLSPTLWADGWCIFGVSTSAMVDSGGSLELVRSGPTSILLHFNSPCPTDGIQILVLGEFEQVISLSPNLRTVLVDGRAG